MKVSLLAAALLFQLVSSHPAPKPAAPEGAAGLSWSVPRSWTAIPSSSSMRLATYRVAAAPGDPEPAELQVFVFGTGQGGSVESNVTRWQGQFEPEGKGVPPPAKKQVVAGVSVTLVRAEGTYETGLMGGPTTPKRGWALSGAIAEGPQGNVFFKLVGPKKTVATAQPELDALVKSLKKG